MTKAMILPGQTIGILGGGQLGRMSAMAAAHMGYKTVLFCPEAAPPAGQVVNRRIRAAYTDRNALKEFAAAVDVVTLEFENIPCVSLNVLAETVPVRPSAFVLDKTRDRLTEKNFVAGQGIDVAPFAAATEVPDDFKFPALLKTRRFGYDGKGQVKVPDRAGLEGGVSRQEAVLESLIDFDCELSVIVARTPSGDISCFPTVRNVHVDGVLDETYAPGGVGETLEHQARETAKTLALALNLEGLLAVELFVTKSGGLLVNEMAPRPHNSGHWSMDGCVTSQFEQHIRAVCNLPLGATGLLAPTRMKNIMGGDIQGIESAFKDPTARVYLYGKSEAKPGRKMGHINFVNPV